MSRLLFGAFAVVSFLFSGTANAALYSQLSTPFVKTSVNDPLLGVTNAYVSQNDVSLPVPIIGIVSDNFRLTSDALVSKINWVGAYSVSSDGERPTFEIGFYEDFFGLPGLEISSISGVAATETPLPDEGYFLYSTIITTPVALMGNTNYWISVMANVPQVVDDWGWAITNADVNPLLRGSVQTYEGVFYQYPSTVNGQVLNFPTVDFAFSLEGSGSAVIPEPMSALVFAGLLGGMAIYRRKKAISANAS
jgi:hypothetical protein